MERRKVFIDCNTQVDYCLSGGNRYGSYVEGSNKILDNLDELTNYAVRKKILVVGSVRTNNYTSKYCIKGTNGWMKVHETYIKKCVYIPNIKTDSFSLPELQSIWFETDSNSMFSNPNIEHIFNQIEIDHDTDFFIYGIMPSQTIYDFLNIKTNKYSWMDGNTITLISDAYSPVEVRNIKTITTKEILNQ